MLMNTGWVHQGCTSGASGPRLEAGHMDLQAGRSRGAAGWGSRLAEGVEVCVEATRVLQLPRVARRSDELEQRLGLSLRVE